MAPPLVSPQSLTAALGHPYTDPDAVAAVQAASALVRSYTGLHVTARDDVAAVLAGTVPAACCSASAR